MIPGWLVQNMVSLLAKCIQYFNLLPITVVGTTLMAVVVAVTSEMEIAVVLDTIVMSDV